MIRVNDEYISNPFFETDPGLEPYLYLFYQSISTGGVDRVELLSMASKKDRYMGNQPRI